MTAPTNARDALSALCLSYLKPPDYSGGSWTLNPDALADAIIAKGWGSPAEMYRLIAENARLTCALNAPCFECGHS